MRILLLNAEALNLAYLGCYGNEWVATPALDRLAAEGVVFDQHYADCPGTRHPAWTGRYRFPGAPPSEAVPELPELLAAHDVPFVHVNSANTDSPTEAETPLERVLEGVLEAVAATEAAENTLIWADLPGQLPPWVVPQPLLDHYFGDERDNQPEPADEEEALEPLTPLLDPSVGPIDVEDITLLERLHHTYAAVMTYLDSGVGLLVEELGRRGLLDTTAVVFTAGRGLALGEHGLVGDSRPWLHDELIHLPLLVRLPDGTEAGLHVSGLTQPVDLLPTLLELLGLPVPGCHGHSLLPLIRGESEQVRAYACSGLEWDGRREWVLRTPAWGLVVPEPGPEDEPPRGPQLYVKPEDRWEVNNVVQHHLELAEELEKVLRGFVEATRAPGPLQAPALPQEGSEHSVASTEYRG
ncbi:MAG: sulfatase-like hydrolase/transferase [Gemmataceae bacterium]|nr:sulfatase-like hydrolase/transferase [Gemmataceae bacterium]